MVRNSKNNTTIINLTKLKDNSTKLILKYNSISRNGVATNTPNTHITYDWKLDNQGNLKDLDTKITIKGVEKYTFIYKKSNNTTTIKQKNLVTYNVITTTRIGFVPVTILTNKDTTLDISY